MKLEDPEFRSISYFLNTNSLLRRVKYFALILPLNKKTLLSSWVYCEGFLFYLLKCST